ncbi:MAG: oxygen-independent coproporphyrinogen III oxidase [Taibaiella sp.]|nr:oxygen-independent coproporphyrinogen III oxidase [Taibaiella sp.]
MQTEEYSLNKYNIPVPRYTSYPTVPYWNEGIDTAEWMSLFCTDFSRCNNDKGISLYIHLPFCESLCTYCGCNKKITNNHTVEDAYINAILREWELYRAAMDSLPVLRELHLGGGTPTFFSPDNLRRLLLPILDSAKIHEEYEFSFEGHPNNTTGVHLQTLYDLGFRRVSYGVQDNDPRVQRIINRMQPFENVMLATERAREVGYKSVNFDLIYGLPLQTQGSMRRTIEETIELRPDRIAFYSYAHVPWTSKGQRLFDERDLPTASEKLELYLLGKQLLLNAGYHDIGMDHFALEHDDLYIAQQEGRLHRSFMGYTTQNTEIMIGLGVSAISTIRRAYMQNDKSLRNYYDAVNQKNVPANKGIFLSEEDIRFGVYIRDISCKGRTTFSAMDMQAINKYCLPEIKELETDGLVEIKGNTVIVSAIGHNFIRNVCSAFDLYLLRSGDANKRTLFSKAV